MNKIYTDSKDLNFISQKEKVRVRKLLSQYVGIASSILERDMLLDRGIYIFQSLSQRITKLSTLHLKEVSSGGLGISIDRKKAFRACIGETLERYSMSFFDCNNFLKEKYSHIPKENRFDKKYLNVYGDIKTPTHFKNPLKDKLLWTKIYKYGSKSEYRYWPASMVYLPFPYESISETTSTGVASHIDMDKAILSGILEIIERDAQMVRHYRNDICECLDILKISNKELRKYISRASKGFRVKIFQMKSPTGIPTYGSYIWRNTKKGIHFGIGACSSLDSDVAIKKALSEALFTYHYSKDILDLKKNVVNEINALYEHFLFYQGDRFDILLNQLSKHEIPYVRQKLDKGSINKILEKSGYLAYYKEITTSDIRSLGYVVVRVVIPGMIDLNKTHILPQKGLLMARKIQKINLNLPHPFP